MNLYLRCATLYLSIAFVASAPAQAAVSTWTGATDSNFFTASNWSGGVPTDIASFNTAGPTTVSIPRGLTFTRLNSFLFNPGASAYTISVNNSTSLMLEGSGIINNSSNAPTLNIDKYSQVILSGSGSTANAVINTSGIPNYIGAIIYDGTSTADHSTITNNFAETHLNGSSTGGNASITNINNGSLSIYYTATAGSATITNSSNATTFIGDRATAGNADITNDSGARTSFANTATAGTAIITNNSGGSTAFYDTTSAGNAIITNNSGGYTIFSKALQSPSNAPPSNATAGNATIINNSGGYTAFYDNTTGGNAALYTVTGGSVDISGLTSSGMTAGSISGSGAFILGSKSLTVGSNHLTTAVSGIISGNGGSLVKVGSGDLTLSGINSYTGSTAINGGTLSILNDNALGGSSGALSMSNGTVKALAGITSSRELTLNAGGGTYDTNGNNVTLSGNVIGTGPLTKTSGGILSLTGNNSYAGGTVINGGIVRVGSTSALGSGAVRIANAAGAVLDLNGFDQTIGSLSGGGASGGQVVIGNAVLTLGADNASNTFAGEISGLGGSLVKVGTGFQVLSGTNTYTGGTTIQAGTLQGDTSSLPGNITDNASLVFNQTSNGTYSGIMSGTGSLTKTGAGTLILTGGNSYAGGTTVSAGTLQGDTASLQGNIQNNASVVFNQGTNGTYAGKMSGSGTFSKMGNGILTLSGVNTYSGGTTISAGTLVVDTLSLPGNVVNNASLVFNQTTDGTYTGIISGAGTLTTQGNGTLTVSGNHTYTGATMINEGTVNLTGSLAGNAVIAAAAALSGNGSLGTLINNGAVTPGVNGSGTLNVSSYSGPGTLNIQLNEGSNTSLRVAGHADITGGTLNVSGTTFSIGQYDVLTAGSLTGTFAAVHTPASIFLTYATVYSPTAASLFVERNGTTYASVTQTGNGQAVAAALDAVENNAPPAFRSTIDAVSQLSASEAQEAFAQMSGDSLASFQGVGLRGAALFINQMNGRAAPSGSLQTAQLMQPVQVAYNGDIRDLGDLRGPASSPTGIWSRGVGLFARTKADPAAGTPDSNATTGGFQFGYDHTAGDHGLLGLSGGYSATHLTVSDRSSSGKSNAMQLGVYGSYAPDERFFVASVGYVRGSNDMARRISFPGVQEQANADFKNQIYTASAEAGYTFKPLRSFTLEPVAGIRETQIRQEAYTETGAPGYNLSVGQNTINSVVSSLGLRVSRRFFAGSAHPLKVGTRAAWQHEFDDPNTIVSAEFADAPGSRFTVKGTPQSLNSAAVGVNGRVALSKNLDAFADYSATVSSDERIQAVMGGLRWKW